jgi:hypothetical protein
MIIEERLKLEDWSEFIRQTSFFQALVIDSRSVAFFKQFPNLQTSDCRRLGLVARSISHQFKRFEFPAGFTPKTVDLAYYSRRAYARTKHCIGVNPETDQILLPAPYEVVDYGILKSMLEHPQFANGEGQIDRDAFWLVASPEFIQSVLRIEIIE